jgi:6-phosphogluconolactonase
MNGETLVFDDPAAVAEAAALRFVSLMAERPGKRFSLALSGGSTPQRFYRLLAASPSRGQIDWSRLHVFLADERFLPLDHPDSNFRMIRETLIEPLNGAETSAPPVTGGVQGNAVELTKNGLGVAKLALPVKASPDTPSLNSTVVGLDGGVCCLPAANIHPMPTDGTVEDCAVRYEAELRHYFGETSPRFDLIVLGMGPDGHTASLFPGHTHPQGPWVLPVHNSPKPPPTRLSLSLELINQARNVWFLVTGHDKAAALSSLRDPSTPALPAGTVQLAEGELIWWVDDAACRDNGVADFLA